MSGSAVPARAQSAYNADLKQPELVLAPDHGYDEWIVMSLNPDGTCGYTEHSYEFVPSPYYDDSFGFIIEHFKNNQRRVLGYNTNHVKQSFNSNSRPYISLCELETTANCPAMINTDWLLSPFEMQQSYTKWNLIVNPIWQQPVIMLPQPDWLSQHLLLCQHLNLVEQRLAYAQYRAELLEQQRSAPNIIPPPGFETTQTQMPGTKFVAKATCRVPPGFEGTQVQTWDVTEERFPTTTSAAKDFKHHSSQAFN